MMRRIIAIGCLLAIPSFAAQPYKVAVIDTGIAPGYHVKLCKTGHLDLAKPDVYSGAGLHGTNISGLIEREAGNVNYCQMIVRWWKENLTSKQEIHNMAVSINFAIDNGAKIINISGGGSLPYPEEQAAIKKALDKGIIIVAAAGNNGEDLSKNCNYYPACYDKRIIVVANLNPDGSRHYLSNYGKQVTHSVIGVNQCIDKLCMTGTSQSTAIVTGRLVNQHFSKRSSASINK